MNALDALFEFTALMATSSAMTLEPDDYSLPSRPAQQPSASKAAAIPEPSPQTNSVQHALLPQSNTFTQPSLTFPSAHQHNRISDPWLIETYPPQQRPSEYQQAWPSEPQPHTQQLSQPQPQPEQQHTHFPPLPSFAYTLPCGHHPAQQCQCAYLPNPSASDSYAAAAPWGVTSVSLQPAVRYVCDEGGCGYGEGSFGQQGEVSMRGCGAGGGVWDGAQGWMGEQGAQGYDGMGGCGLHY